MEYSEEHTFNETYDFAVVNHHYWVNNWITQEMVQQFGKPVFCIVTEVTFGEHPMGMTPNFFTGYLVLDPSIKDTDNMWGFPRPLEQADLVYKPTEIPIIGSFGFATGGKDWHKIMELVNNEFDHAIIRFNIPKGTYVQDETHNENINQIREQALTILTKQGISFELTHNNYTKPELIEWCSKNTINVFLYNRNYTCGLSAVTDQAIVSKRPLLVSSDLTFRHIHQYIPHYPQIGIKQAIEQTGEGVLKMNHDWSPEVFLKKFENRLAGIHDRITDINVSYDQVLNRIFIHLMIGKKPAELNINLSCHDFLCPYIQGMDSNDQYYSLFKSLNLLVHENPSLDKKQLIIQRLREQSRNSPFVKY
jgi:hypothetical protein